METCEKSLLYTKSKKKNKIEKVKQKKQHIHTCINI